MLTQMPEPDHDWGFCFLDIETTGLDPNKDEILEVGLVFVSWDLESVLATYSHQIDFTIPIGQWSDVVVQMHEHSGLLRTLQEGSFPNVSISSLNIEDDITYVRDGNGWEKVILAGFSPHFDRSFLKVHMPRVEALFNYRMLDCSAFKVLASTIDLKVESENPNPHRAINDCYEALAVARNMQEIFKRA